MDRIRLAIWTFMLLLFSVTIWGDEIYFRSLGVKDGLSQPSSIAIWQDRLGRIWLGNNAVNCYDGISTKVIRLSEYFPSLEDANIHNFCGNDSTLYLLAENNIICIDLQMRQPFMPEITATAICYSDNQLYTVEGHSLYRCNIRSGEKEILFSDERYVFTLITPIGDNQFWIGTTTGVLKVDLTEKRIITTCFQEENITTQFLDSESRLWLSAKSGLAAVVSLNGESIVLNDSGGSSIPYIHCFTEDTRGIIWVGTLTGLYRIEMKTNGIPEIMSNQPYMAETSITALFTDRQGNLWIGPYYGDIRYGNIDLDDFKCFYSDEKVEDRLHGTVIGSMAEDKEGNLYVASEGSGINVLNKNREVIRHITKTTHRLPDNKIRALWYDEQTDNLFISVYKNGLYVLDRKTDRIRQIDFSFFDSASQLTIEEIVPYRDVLVLPSTGGIFKLDRENLHTSYLLDNSLLQQKCSGNIRTIYIDDKDRLWVSSLEEGLFSVDLKSQKVISVYGDGLQKGSRIPSAVNSICGDSRNGLFMSTLNSGLLLYNEERNDFSSYREQDHFLLSDVCYSVTRSFYRNLIVATDKGVSILDMSVKKKPLSAFHIPLSNLPAPLSLSGDCGIYVSPMDRNVYVGTICGLFSFNEQNLNRSGRNYSLFFSSISVNNQLLTPANSDFLQQDIAFSRKIKLPYNLNTISLTFSTSNYLLSNYGQYEYKMEGLDELWITTSNRTITYSSLRPGKYNLIVRDLDNPQNEVLLEIIIMYPFWLSWPMILLYVCVTISIIAWLVWFNKTKTRLMLSLEMKKMEVEQMDKLNRDNQQFLTNISNEFRKPLTVIIAILNNIVADAAVVAGKNRIGKVLKQVVYLQGLITRLQTFNREEQEDVVFSFENPVCDAESPVEEVIETEGNTLYTMLIIDSDSEIRASLKETFSFAYRLIEAEDVKEGYLIALRELPDIILSEIDMADGSGIELCRMIKSHVDTLHIPVILMTYQPSPEQQIQSIRSGADDYVVKPFFMDLLQHRCNSLVRNSKRILSRYIKQKEEQEYVPLLATNVQEKRLLDTATRVLEEHLEDPEFDIAHWAKCMGMGRTSLFNQIKMVTGMTPNDYIVSFKMDRAKLLLSDESCCPIAEVAYRLGYSDPIYFSRTFKKHVGVSPMQYRKNMLVSQKEEVS